MTTAPPMFGEFTGHVQIIKTVSIHGDIYFDVALLPDEGPALATRVPSHLCDRPPAPGDRMTLSFLMGQVNGAAYG